MMRKPGRIVTPEEKALFEHSFREARPLADKISSVKTRESAAVKTGKSNRAGVDGRTVERLRRGLLEPEARLDLHGFTEGAAHRALLTFLRAAHLRGHRLVLVVTGKGTKPHDPHAPFDLEFEARSRGVLKSMVPRWLAEPSLAPIVAAVHEAHRKHGGAGALYIYLRKLGKRR